MRKISHVDAWKAMADGHKIYDWRNKCFYFLGLEASVNRSHLYKQTAHQTEAVTYLPKENIMQVDSKYTLAEAQKAIEDHKLQNGGQVKTFIRMPNRPDPISYA